jgi:hypothetical protein
MTVKTYEELVDYARDELSWEDPEVLVDYVTEFVTSIAEFPHLDEYASEVEDYFVGTYDSGADYAQEIAEDTIPDFEAGKWPYSSIDWDDAWRDLEYEGYRISQHGHVFSN